MVGKTRKARTARTTKTAAGARRPGKAAKVDVSRRALDAALALAARRRWRDIALADVAAAAKVSMAELYAVYPSRTAIVLALIRRVDAEVLAGAAAEVEAEPPRDRLFDVLMRRFDALAPHKEAVASIVADLPADPLAGACVSLQLAQSMGWMLEAAGIDSSGLPGLMRAKGLSLLWLWTLRVWLADDSPDMARTMAALDKGLRRAERLAGLLPGGRRGGAGSAAAPEPPGA